MAFMATPLDLNTSTLPEPSSIFLQNSQPESHNSVTAVKGDKELFLKVLENCINATKKPNGSVIVTKNMDLNNGLLTNLINTTGAEDLGVSEFKGLSSCEVHAVPARSDAGELGTKTATVSDKTKSLILQKLASGSEKLTHFSNLIIDLNENTERKTTDGKNAMGSDSKVIPINSVGVKDINSENVVVSVVGLDKFTHNVSGKSLVMINRDSINIAQDKAIHNNHSSSVQLYPCNFCDYYSDNKNYLKQHVDLVHNSDRPFKCPYCDYAGKRSHALREHLIVHTDERPFQCEICNATFRKKGHLTNHVKLHNSKRLVKCPLCKALVYDSGENGLDAHLKNDHDTERLYGCDLCDHVAASEPDILQHLNNKHKSKLLVFKCNKCAFETASSVEYNSHVTAHAMVDSNVQIGDGTAAKVIGVAALLSGSHCLGTQNSNVSLSTQGNEEVNQPALIKPVWIKCSDCGFMAQDSEVIKKHMVEHLKAQYGENYIYQLNDQSLADTEKVPSASTPVHQIFRQSAMPILVPVTNVESLLPQHTRNIDKNTPILVPITGSSFQNVHGSSAISLEYPSGKVNSSSSIIATKTVTLGEKKIADIKAIVSSMSNSSSKPMYVVSNKSSSEIVPQIVHASIPVPSGQKSVSLQPHQLQQMLNNTNLKVVPITMINGQKGTLTAALTTKLPAEQSDRTEKASVIQNPIPGLYHGSSSIQLPSPITSAQSSVSIISHSIGYNLKEIPAAGDIATKVLPQLPSGNYLKHTITQHDKDFCEEQKITSLHQQSKLSENIGNFKATNLSDLGFLEKSTKQNVVCYIAPASKQNYLKNAGNVSFTHDATSGRFRCTLCGYTCEYQRTIKAHIWKHSGNKNINYPMFQNGPLSVYEDEYEGFATEEPDHVNTVIEVKSIIESDSNQMQSAAKMKSNGIVNESSAGIHSIANNLPSFIVFEETKISNVAPILAHLIAARTMAGMNNDDSGSKDSVDDDQSSTINEKGNAKINQTGNVNNCNDSMKSSDLSVQMDNVSEMWTEKRSNVVVETIDTLATNASFTGMHSQQNSPRANTRSPDSGVSEMTLPSKTTDEQIYSSGINSPALNCDMKTDEINQRYSLRSNRKRAAWHLYGSNESNASPKSDNNVEVSAAKKVVHAREDAVTLLSLLKKGPNFNPACPPKHDYVTQISANQSAASSLELEEAKSLVEADVLKPKFGISTSLLAVIEQLRERSKSDIEDERPPPLVKKQSKRRSRKSSVEDDTPAAGIANIEEFFSEGEVKYRCKLCHYTNESTVLLRQHMRMHKPKQEFECSLCDLIAESSEALQDHMIQHCKVRTYQCKMCNSAFNYKSQLRAHLRMHNNKDILVCDCCDFETRNPAFFKVHAKTHFTKPSFKCELCSEEFITSNNLRIHKRDGCFSTADKARDEFKCDECEFTSTGRREIKNHQRLHMGKTAALVPKRCPHCDHFSPSLELIRKHVTDVHGESKPLRCEMCGFVAVSVRSLKSHMKRHINDQRFVSQPLEQYKCNLCGYVCHHLPSLKSHMWRHAANQHYSYEFTNDVINTAIDFDSRIDVSDTIGDHVDNYKRLIFEKMISRGLENSRDSLEESAIACCWVIFRCCQCGFETINKAELNLHMNAHVDVIKMTLDVADDSSVHNALQQN